MTEDDLTRALVRLYSYVYGVTESVVSEAAHLRVIAMRLSDEWVERGCQLEDPLLADERRTLVASYAPLRNGIDRSTAK